jgi:putative ABC transport system permease protein
MRQGFLGKSELEVLSHLPVQVLASAGRVSATGTAQNGEELALSLIGQAGGADQIDPSINLIAGRYFTPAEDQYGAAVVVLTTAAAAQLFGGADPLGHRISLLANGYPISLSVIGVAQTEMGGQRLTAYVPNGLIFQQVPGWRPGEYASATLFLDSDADLAWLTTQVETLIAGRFPAESYRVSSGVPAWRAARVEGSGEQTLLAGIATIALLVGGIGILSIMWVSVSERTSEIGLRKALGAVPAVIMLQFLIEAGLLTLLGGTLGAGMAAGALYLLIGVLPTFPELLQIWPALAQFASLSFQLSAPIFVIALLVSVTTGLIFGLLPAARAARLDPIEALREE